MEFKGKQIKKSMNNLNKYVQQHVMHSYHLRPMINYIKKNNQKDDLIGIEIGVLRAENAYSIMYHLPMQKLYLIDPYTLYDDGINKYQNRDKDLEIAKKRMKSFGDKIVFVIQPSEVVYKEFLTGPYEPYIDFVYIDGAHDYQHVKQDIELYYPIVRKGGIIGGHDFRADCEGLCRAVLEFVDKNNLKLNGWITDWWIEKQ